MNLGHVIGNVELIEKDKLVFGAVEPSPPLSELIHRLSEIVMRLTCLREPLLAWAFDFYEDWREIKRVSSKP